MNSNKRIVILACLVVGVIVAVLVGGTISYYTSSRSETVTVSEKERVCSTKTCRYLVWTDKGVLENSDDPFLGKNDSSDVQGQLKIGHTYNVTIVGWRIPAVSSYPNISEVKAEVSR